MEDMNKYVLESTRPNPFSLMAEGKTSQAFGYVAADCIHDLGILVEHLFFDHEVEDEEPMPARRYTKVCCYEYTRYRPEVWTGQQAESIKLQVEDDTLVWGAITIVDTYGVWSIDSRLRTQPKNGVEDVLRNTMYVVIDTRSMQIKLRTPEGREAWWHVQLEE